MPERILEESLEEVKYNSNEKPSRRDFSLLPFCST